MPDYRRLEKADSGDEGEEDLLGGLPTFEEDVRSRTAEFERHLQLHPDDIDGWIEYSKLHLRLNPEQKRRKGTLDAAQTKVSQASAEVTLSILSRALDAHDTNNFSTRLHIAYLKAAETFWPVPNVTSRWERVLSELTGKQAETDIMPLWLGYLDWCEGHGFGKGGEEGEAGGGVDGILAIYEDALRALGSTGKSYRLPRQGDLVS